MQIHTNCITSLLQMVEKLVIKLIGGRAKIFSQNAQWAIIASALRNGWCYNGCSLCPPVDMLEGHYMYNYKYIYTHTHIYIHICTHTYIHIYTLTYVYTRIYTHTQSEYILQYMYIVLCAYMYINTVQLCMYV